MTMKIEIIANDGADAAQHIRALIAGLADPKSKPVVVATQDPVAGGLTFVRTVETEDAVYKVPDRAAFMDPDVQATPGPIEAGAVVTVTAPAIVPDAQKRHRRTKAEMEAARAAALAGGPPVERPVEPKPAISTGEERVNPQDEADLAAEAKPSDKLTLTDVRRAVKEYADKFGPEAGVQDLRALIGRPISEIPDTQEDIGAALDKIMGAVNSGRRPGAPPATKEEPPTDDLFGEPEPKPQPITKATVADLRAVAEDYAKKYDPASPPASSVIAQQDVSRIISQIFGPTVTTSRQIREMAGDSEARYGLVVMAMRQAIVDNPFKR